MTIDEPRSGTGGAAAASAAASTASASDSSARVKEPMPSFDTHSCGAFPGTDERLRTVTLEPTMKAL